MEPVPAGTGRRVLMVGGTGMLAPLARAVPARDLILAARFKSNQAELEKMPEGVLYTALDYRDPQSREAFLKELCLWQDIAWCVMWIHSDSHEFSADIMATLAAKGASTRFIHVFGSTNSPSALAEMAAKLKVDFIPVQLGRAHRDGGSRWMTHEEISNRVGAALARTYPDLGEMGLSPLVSQKPPRRRLR